MTVKGVLIADEDMVTRKQMAEMFIQAGYQVTVSSSAAGALCGILKRSAQVVLLSQKFDELLATELIPILKHCNRDLGIILVASELPLALIRRARREGIFYHALHSGCPGDENELQEAVRCAFEKVARQASGCDHIYCHDHKGAGENETSWHRYHERQRVRPEPGHENGT